MNTQPEGSGQSRYYYEAAEPPQEYPEEYQTEYSTQSSWQASNYEPEIPQTHYRTGDGPSTYTQQAETQQASSRYSYSSTRTRADEYNAPQRYPCQACNETFIRSSDRTRHFNTVHLDNGERRFRCEVEDCPADVTTWRRSEKLKTHNKTWHSYSCEEPGCVRGYPHGFKTQEDLEAHRQQAHGQQGGLYEDGPMSATSKGKSIYVNEAEVDGYLGQSEERSYMQATDRLDPYAPQSTYATSSRSMYTASNDPMYAPNSRSILDDRLLGDSQAGEARRISTSVTSSVLDDRYIQMDEKVHKRFWKIGRVFMMLWTEPTHTPRPTQTPISRPSSAGSQYNTVWLGSQVYSEIRRFVIIGEGYGNVICSPIHTYNGQATLKRNLPDPQQHAIIYTSFEPPAALNTIDDEGNIISEQLTKDPIRVVSELKGPDGDLGIRSRINYAKIYTVEKYVRVLNIGKVHKDFVEALVSSSLFARPKDQPPEGPRRGRRDRGRR